MFKGAKVVSGPDWEWKESEGGSGMEGEVTEITGWNDESKNDAVRVAWKKGPRENIYRLGNNGKVRLFNYTVPKTANYISEFRVYLFQHTKRTKIDINRSGL